MERGLLRTIIALALLWALAVATLFAMHPTTRPLAHEPGKSAPPADDNRSADDDDSADP